MIPSFYQRESGQELYSVSANPLPPQCRKKCGCEAMQVKARNDAGGSDVLSHLKEPRASGPRKGLVGLVGFLICMVVTIHESRARQEATAFVSIQSEARAGVDLSALDDPIEILNPYQGSEGETTQASGHRRSYQMMASPASDTQDEAERTIPEVTVPMDHELGEWYEFAYRQGALAQEVHGWFKQIAAPTQATLLQILDALNLSPASLGTREMELLSQGYLDGVQAKPRQYQMAESQVRSVLPSSIQGFSRFSLDPLASADAQTLLEHAIKSTVMIRTEDGHGTGFFVAPGMVLTNKHVVGTASSVEVRIEETRVVQGRVVSVSNDYDVAVVKVDVRDHAYLHLMSHDEVRIAEDVVAIGYPQLADLSAVLNFGKISSKDRSFRDNPCYQIDVSLNKGNSGGPLVSTKTGKVVGINTFSLVSLGVVDRFNFSVVIDVAVRHFETYHPEVGLMVD